MKSRAVVFWLAVLFLFSGAMTFWIGWRMMGRASEATTARQSGTFKQLTDFTLTDQHGVPFHSRTLSGKVWIASFFFTNCPSACRMQNTQVANLQRDYRDADVHFVSMTCDPDRDTPAALSQYAHLFGANPDRWHFLTGNLDDIKSIGQLLQTTVEAEMHSDRLFVIDREGKTRGGFRSTQPEQFSDLKTLVDELLAGRPEQERDDNPSPQGNDPTNEAENVQTHEAEVVGSNAVEISK